LSYEFSQHAFLSVQASSRQLEFYICPPCQRGRRAFCGRGSERRPPLGLPLFRFARGRKDCCLGQSGKADPFRLSPELCRLLARRTGALQRL